MIEQRDPYDLISVFAEVCAQVKDKLLIQNLNFQYGYLRELNETLVQFSQTPEYAVKKYPLVWLAQPYTEDMNTVSGFASTVTGMRVFVISGSEKNWKAEQRLNENFRPLLRPIYRSLIRTLGEHPAVEWLPGGLPHRKIERYYWGESQQASVTDVVDLIEISNLSFKTNFQPIC